MATRCVQCLGTGKCLGLGMVMKPCPSCSKPKELKPLQPLQFETTIPVKAPEPIVSSEIEESIAVEPKLKFSPPSKPTYKDVGSNAKAKGTQKGKAKK